MSKKRYFRGVKVKLECGHTAIIATSLFRIKRSLLSCIYNDASSGVWCFICSSMCHPVEGLGTVRL